MVAGVNMPLRLLSINGISNIIVRAIIIIGFLRSDSERTEVKESHD